MSYVKPVKIKKAVNRFSLEKDSIWYSIYVRYQKYSRVAHLILTLFAQLLGGTDEGTDGKESPSLLSYHHKQNASKIDTLRLSSSYLGYIRITYLHRNANSNGTNNII